MSIVVNLAPHIEDRLRAEAERRGQSLEALAGATLRELAEQSNAVEGVQPLPMASEQLEPAPEESLVRRMLQMSPEEQDAIFFEAAQRAAPLYEADLALPWEERDLTAFCEFDEVIYDDDPADEQSITVSQ